MVGKLKIETWLNRRIKRRISNFLNFDDALFRIFSKGDIRSAFIILDAGKASYRWAGAHTPDTCWVLNGWTRLEREYAVYSL